MKKNFAKLILGMVVAVAAVLLGRALIRRIRGFRDSVLIAGGNPHALQARQVDVYSRLTGFQSGSSQMIWRRQFHTETWLFTAGRILFTGGRDDGNTVFNVAELYDPNSDRFRPTAGTMVQERVFHTATSLPDGKVFIAGGESSTFSVHDNAELYDPDTDTFTAVASLMPQALRNHTATVTVDINDNVRVLLVGSGIAFLYDLFSQTFIMVNSGANDRSFHTATALSPGYVLITGGIDSNNIVLNTAEVFSPDYFDAVGNMAESRRCHTATFLKNGKVLIAGGMNNEGNILDSAELLDGNIFIPVSARMTRPRFQHTATLLQNGEVLIVGGKDANYGPLATAEIYSPVTNSFRSIGTLSMPRSGHTATVLETSY